MEVLMYSFEKADGSEGSVFTTFNPQEAKEHGQKYGLMVIENKFEFTDSELAWDFTGVN